MRRLAPLLLAVVIVSSLPVSAVRAQQTPGKLKVLLITGQNNHDWQRVAPYYWSVLTRSGRFTVDIVTSPSADADDAAWKAFTPQFEQYDLVLSNYYGQMWPRHVREDFERYVSNGGGVVLVHAATAPFPQWKAFNQMVGLSWRERDFGDGIVLTDDGTAVRVPKGEGRGADHGRVHEFDVIVIEPEHPIMADMPTRWLHGADELYHAQRGPAQNMRILAMVYSDPDTGGSGANEPIVWIIPFGKGQVVTTVLGHLWPGQEATDALDCVGFQTLLLRMCEFAGTGKVTIPIPDNFPIADDVSLSNTHEVGDD